MKDEHRAPSERSQRPSLAGWASPHPFYKAAAFIGLICGIAGWVLASTRPGVLVPVCATSAILFGLLGVRSSFRSLGLLGFIMGMFLLPNAVSTVLHVIHG
jgi:hypothetical protein